MRVVGCHKPSAHTGLLLEPVENWTVGSIVAVAASRQSEQRLAHSLQRIGLPPKLCRAVLRQCLDLRTGAIAIGPQIKQRSDFFDREAEIAGVGYEAKAMNGRNAIIAIAAISSSGWWDQADLLVMPDHPLRDPSRIRHRSDVHKATRLRRSAFVTTLTDDKAMAAAAMIGDSNMPKNG